MCLKKVVQTKYDEPDFQHLFSDSGYRGKLEEWVKGIKNVFNYCQKNR